MEYQKVIKFLDNSLYQPSKLRTKKWFEMNVDANRTYNTNSQIELITSVLKSSLCNYSDDYILVGGIITITKEGASDAAKQEDETEKRVRFKNCAPFADYINVINNTQIDNTKDIDVVMPIYD